MARLLNELVEWTKTQDGLHRLHLQQNSHGAGEAPLPQPQDAPTLISASSFGASSWAVSSASSSTEHQKNKNTRRYQRNHKMHVKDWKVKTKPRQTEK